MAELELQSVLTCPHCGHQELETMPANACVAFYDCKGCGKTLKPLPGSCCVFCSYGAVPCPPIQQGVEPCCTPIPDKRSQDWLRNARARLLGLWGPTGCYRGGSTGKCAIANWPMGRCSCVDGYRVSTERSPVWSNALPLHRSHYLAMVIPVLAVGAGLFRSASMAN